MKPEYLLHPGDLPAVNWTDRHYFATYELDSIPIITSVIITSVIMTPDRYQKPPQAPPSFNATPESLIADAKKLNDICRNMMNKMVEDVKPETATFGNTVLLIALDENESSLSSRIIEFY